MGERRHTNDRLIEATTLDREQLRMFAENVLAEHDPDVQNHGHGIDRCGLCDFTRHPCDTFDLAAYVVMLLDGSIQPAPADRPVSPPIPQEGRETDG